MRLTNHNGRTGKDGVYSAKHNDRNFESISAEHDSNLSWKNRYLNHDTSANSFEDGEKNFYDKHFSKFLNKRNQTYIKNRQYKHIWSMDDYRKNPRSCPEETIMQIGDRNSTVSGAELWDIVIKQLQWEHKMFPNVKLLNVALHMDEAGAPHVHQRKVWTAKGKDGLLQVSQTKALKEMGIQAPEPDSPITRYNNPKQTYSKLCREHFIELCRERGLDIQTEPKEASKSGLSLLEYKRQQEESRMRSLETERNDLIRQLDAKSKRLDKLQARIEDSECRLAEAEVLQQDIQELQERTDKLQSQIQDLKREKSIYSSIEVDKAVKTAKTSFLGDNVKIPKEKFDALTNTAYTVDKVIKDGKRIRKKYTSLIKDAKAEAESIVQDAKEKACSMNLNQNLEKVKLEAELREFKKLQEKFPEQFKQMRQHTQSHSQEK